MRIGFMISKNLLSAGYPFLETIYSWLNVVDKIYILDDSNDGTEQFLATLSKNTRIVIKNRSWQSISSESLSYPGSIYATVSNYLLNYIEKQNFIKSTDLVYYIQANEIVHEKTYAFLSQLDELFPDKEAFLTYYYELIGPYVFSAQFRPRIARFLTHPQVQADGWMMGVTTPGSVRHLGKKFARDTYNYLVYRSLSRDFIEYYNYYEYLYTPEPIYRFSWIFPDNVLAKAKASKTVINLKNSEKNLYEPLSKIVYSSPDEFYSKCLVLFKDFTKTIWSSRGNRLHILNQKIISPPKVMDGILNESKYIHRNEIVDRILSL